MAAMTERAEHQVEHEAEHEAEPQGAIVDRLLSGQGTLRDARVAGRNFERWLREEWDDRSPLAVERCAEALAAAWGDGWRALPERDSAQHVWLFGFLCPNPEALAAEAAGYVGVVRGSGGAQAVARRVRLVRGLPE
ncbi:hypothetical protein VM98_08635 [Streptomyces rubellomurinus subsp. indigoferus]|nr:hypothetical protein VM98_08635 [Streptomyces rubellomurinus subsp. indigoferus]